MGLRVRACGWNGRTLLARLAVFPSHLVSSASGRRRWLERVAVGRRVFATPRPTGGSGVTPQPRPSGTRKRERAGERRARRGGAARPVVGGRAGGRAGTRPGTGGARRPRPR